MNNKLFVGNLAYQTSDAELQELFAEHGAVNSVQVAKDRETGRSRGFAFVEMESKEDAEAAIQHFNGETIDGRKIVVNESRPKVRSR